MTRLPPALWLLGLALCVSWLTREPAPRAAPAPVARSAAARPAPARPAPVLPDAGR
jgi:hypothetical protein